MLKRKLCELTVDLECHSKGPLLIADGRYDPPAGMKLPNKVFISRESKARLAKVFQETLSAEAEKLDYFIPATSLRGPVRSRAEMIVRTLAPADARPPETACDPFEQQADQALCSCSKRLETEAGKPYAIVCPACRMFGCAGLASRTQLLDGEFSERPRSVYREMIGIDRFKGGVKDGANFKLHVLEDSRFTTSITIVNFELWQVGLLAYLLKDLAESTIRFGHGKSKGFGEVKAKVKGLRVSYPAWYDAGKGFAHLASLCGEADIKSYKLAGDTKPVAVDLKPIETAETVFRLYSEYEVPEPEKLWVAAAPVFNKYLDGLSRTEDAA